MNTKNVALAEEYYTFVGNKNIEEVKKILHPNVQFKGPLAVLKGKEAVAQATYNFMSEFKSLKIRAKFGEGDQAIIVYDVDIPGIKGAFPGASLLNFQDGQIVSIELFYDASHFQKKKERIFSQ